MQREPKKTKRERQEEHDREGSARFVERIAAVLALPDAERDLENRTGYERAAVALAATFPGYEASDYAAASLAVVKIGEQMEGITEAEIVACLDDLTGNLVGAMLLYTLPEHLQKSLRPIVEKSYHARFPDEQSEPLTLAEVGLGHLAVPYPDPAPPIEPIVLDDDEPEPPAVEVR
jgi:hypothetical protein